MNIVTEEYLVMKFATNASDVFYLVTCTVALELSHCGKSFDNGSLLVLCMCHQLLCMH
jgi:hypothetical protein